MKQTADITRPLSDDALKEIRYIVDGIKEGKLLHDQSRYHKKLSCGTSHCIAGYKIVLDYAKASHRSIELATNAKEKTFYNFVDYKFEDDGNYGADPWGREWHYARIAWGLSLREAEDLFYYSLTLGDIEDTLLKLERGERW